MSQENVQKLTAATVLIFVAVTILATAATIVAAIWGDSYHAQYAGSIAVFGVAGSIISGIAAGIASN